MDETRSNNPHDNAKGTEAPEESTVIPRAILTRMMHRRMPPHSKITSDAKDAMDRCVAEFGKVVMRAATKECRRDRRLTVTADDLILGMSSLGLDDYTRPLAEYLRRYRASGGTMTIPRGRQILTPPPVPAAVLPTVVEEEEGEETPPPPPSPGLTLTLQLAPPTVRDITELGFDTDVYAVWQAKAKAAQAGPSRKSPPAADE